MKADFPAICTPYFKKGNTIHTVMSLSNPNQFSKLFRRLILYEPK